MGQLPCALVHSGVGDALLPLHQGGHFWEIWGDVTVSTPDPEEVVNQVWLPDGTEIPPQ